MADNNAKIRIPIDIPPGDVSGAEVAKKEIEEVKDAANAVNDEAAARERQQREDVAAAQRLASARRVDALEAEMVAEKKAAAAAKDAAVAKAGAIGAVLVVAKQSLQAILDTAEGARKLGLEAPPAFEALEKTIRLAKDPVGELIEMFTGISAELKALEESQKRVAETEKQLAEATKTRNEELKKAAADRINNELKTEITLIDAQTAAYERQLRVVKKVAEAQEAYLRALEDSGIADGTMDSNTVASNRAAREAARDSAAADNEAREAAKNVEAFRDKVEKISNSIRDANAAGLPEEAERLLDQLAAARAGLSDAEDELATVEQEAAANKAAIASKAVAEQQGIVEETNRTLTDLAKDAKKTLEDEAKETGRQLTAGSKEALRLLTDALKDGIVTPEEMGNITLAINQVKTSRDAADAEILKAFTELEKGNKAAIEALGRMPGLFADQARQIQDLNARLSRAGY